MARKLRAKDVITFMKVRNGGPVTARDVAEYFGVSYNAAVRTLGWLEKDGRVRADFETSIKATSLGLLRVPVGGTFKYFLTDSEKKVQQER